MMSTRQAITSCRLVLLCAAFVVCVYLLAGCEEYAQTDYSADPMLKGPDNMFQEARNRPPSPRTLYAMADILATQGRDRECEVVLGRIVQQYPQFLPAYNRLAEVQMRQSRIRPAINTLSKGLRIHPSDPVLLNNLGICLLVREDYGEALEMFTKAAAVVPENARYRANMAATLGLMQRYEESLSLFRQVLPKDEAVHNVDVLRRAAEGTSTDSDQQNATG